MTVPVKRLLVIFESDSPLCFYSETALQWYSHSIPCDAEACCDFIGLKRSYVYPHYWLICLSIFPHNSALCLTAQRLLIKLDRNAFSEEIELACRESLSTFTFFSENVCSSALRHPGACLCLHACASYAPAPTASPRCVQLLHAQHSASGGWEGQ